MARFSRDRLSEPMDVTNFLREVGERLRTMRIARGITQADMATRAEINRKTLMAIEAGAATSRFLDIARLLWLLDDGELRRILADASRDEAYREALRARLPNLKSRAKDPFGSEV